MTDLTAMSMPDGSRCFYTPELSTNPQRLRQLVSNVPGVKISGSMDCDEENRCWFEFQLIEEKCKVHNPFATYTYWFIVENPTAETEILIKFIRDLETLLEEE